MESFAGLVSDHTEIVRLAARLRLRARGAVEADEARRAIAELSHLLRAHLIAEDRVVYRRLLASRDQGIAETARAARQSFATLAREWRRFTTRWTIEAITDDPAAFATDTGSLLDRLDARVVFENETLYPLAVGLANLPLHDHAAGARTAA